ncbi:protein of unknown function [Pseudorhizobium banfieldiae]|uniref:Uncharacterized protein n=1 Tax=Pseudorhizobium banfieldiae TaxID=1125847 RepID=L0NDJ0_9HYPH|nr:hypothetical protein [Pseudorhizobium banfieldiae]CAD6606214.1 hypothetical protein RNT25_01813 [arsenite-oxidising bacterium NT-25]CCF19158.1 protein of unknown function [Pseudorhizobium banfieldiae]
MTTKYRAKIDTMIDGKPVREGAEVNGLSEDKAKGYLKAGLIEEDKPAAKDKDTEKTDKVFEDAAKRIDTTSDKRTEK